MHNVSLFLRAPRLWEEQSKLCTLGQLWACRKMNSAPGHSGSLLASRPATCADVDQALDLMSPSIQKHSRPSSHRAPKLHMFRLAANQTDATTAAGASMAGVTLLAQSIKRNHVERGTIATPPFGHDTAPSMHRQGFHQYESSLLTAYRSDEDALPGSE